MIERALYFYNSPEHKLVRPVPGALEAIKELANGYSLQIFTSRPEGVRKTTLAWIEQHFNEVFDDFHFTNIFAGKKEHKPIAKSEVCQKIGAVVLIDDALRHAHDVSLSDIPVLLPDRPWNQGIVPARVSRVYSWTEILKWIRQNVLS